MKAIRVNEFGGPEVLRLEEIADPKPGPGQLVVRMEATGVNPVDAYIRSGNYPRLPPLPYTPGSDGAGTVEATGEGSTQFEVGERVFLSGSVTGTYAELALCEPGHVHRLPAHVSSPQGAAIGIPYATAFRALFHKARAVGAETVLVHGATGGVGLAAAELARAAGMIVIGTGGSEEGRRLALEHGAHHVFDHHEPDYLSKVVALTGGNGVDVILELLANVNLGADLNILAKHGRVIVIGSRGTVEIDPRATMGRDLSILGMSIANASAGERASIYAALSAGLENHTLRPVIGTELPLAEAAEAHRRIMEPGARGKIILIP
jgi:NADPH2:quinone reductase